MDKEIAGLLIGAALALVAGETTTPTGSVLVPFVKLPPRPDTLYSSGELFFVSYWLYA
jgi:hypothetical protein